MCREEAPGITGGNWCASPAKTTLNPPNGNWHPLISLRDSSILSPLWRCGRIDPRVRLRTRCGAFASHISWAGRHRKPPLDAARTGSGRRGAPAMKRAFPSRQAARAGVPGPRRRRSNRGQRERTSAPEAATTHQKLTVGQWKRAFCARWQ